jgi:hypothetical protein
MASIESMGVILAFLLVVFGLIYTFLRGLGKLSDTGGEIGSRLLTLKGGSGLILVALGVILLAVTGLPQEPATTPTPTPLPTDTPIPTPTTMPTVTTTIPKPTTQISTQQGIIGTWSAITEYGTEIISLYSDGSFELTVYQYSGGTSYISGTYALVDSELYLLTNIGTTAIYSLEYMDQNNIIVNGVSYTRIE